MIVSGGKPWDLGFVFRKGPIDSGPIWESLNFSNANKPLFYNKFSRLKRKEKCRE